MVVLDANALSSNPGRDAHQTVRCPLFANEANLKVSFPANEGLVMFVSARNNQCSVDIFVCCRETRARDACDARRSCGHGAVRYDACICVGHQGRTYCIEADVCYGIAFESVRCPHRDDRIV